jgi:hypothetical protein
LEALDSLAREFFDVSSSNDETNQKSLLEKAREYVKSLTDKNEQKRYRAFFLFYLNFIIYFILVVNLISK